MENSDSAKVIGRERSRHVLREAVAGSAAGRSGAVLVSGTAGMGKTTLLRDAADATAALEPPGVVGWGTCRASGAAPGFWPWMEAFGDLVDRVGRARSRLPGQHRAAARDRR